MTNAHKIDRQIDIRLVYREATCEEAECENRTRWIAGVEGRYVCPDCLMAYAKLRERIAD